MNVKDPYLPALVWLHKDEAERYLGKSSETSSPHFDHSIAVSGLSCQQVGCGDISRLQSEKQTELFKNGSAFLEREPAAEIFDELFLPPRNNSTSNIKTLPRHTTRPPSRNLHPAQSLPSSERRLDGLPASFVSGYYPSRSAKRFLALSNTLGTIPEAVESLPSSPSWIPIWAKHLSGVSDISVEPVKSTTYKPWRGQESSSVEKFDQVEFAQVSSQNGFRKQADIQDLQVAASTSYKIPPLQVGPSFRFSGVFQAAPTEFGSSEQTPKSPRAELYPPNGLRKNVECQRDKQEFHDEVADFPSLNRAEIYSMESTGRLDSVDIPRAQSNVKPSVQDTNQDFQARKSSFPELPPIRPVSTLRFSGIFPNFLADSATILSGNNAGKSLSEENSKAKRWANHFLGSFDGIHDDAMQPEEQLGTLRRKQATTSVKETFRKRVRRYKGCENLRMASKSFTS